MAAPLPPYIITGNVRKGPRGGYYEAEHTVDTSGGGVTVNLFLDAGVAVAASQSVSIYNISTNETVSATTDGSGNYTYDLSNLSSGYSNGNSLRIFSDDINATRGVTSTDSTRVNRPEADGRSTRVVMPGRLGKEHTEEYPLPVQIMNTQVNSENSSVSYTYSGGLLSTETQTIKGRQFRKSYTYSSGLLSTESAWEEL